MIKCPKWKQSCVKDATANCYHRNEYKTRRCEFKAYRMPADTCFEHKTKLKMIPIHIMMGKTHLDEYDIFPWSTRSGLLAKSITLN